MSRISKAEMSRLLSVYFIMGSNNCTEGSTTNIERCT